MHEPYSVLCGLVYTLSRVPPRPLPSWGCGVLGPAPQAVTPAKYAQRVLPTSLSARPARSPPSWALPPLPPLLNMHNACFSHTQQQAGP